MSRSRIIVYKLMTLLWGICLLAVIFYATVGDFRMAGLFIIATCMFLLGQAGLVKCPHCGTRPGVWVLAIWTLLLDPAFYIADVLLLKRCPKCETLLADNDNIT